VAVVPIILILGLLLWQVVLTGYTYVMAGHAARQGAHSLAVIPNGTSPVDLTNTVKTQALADVSSSWQRDATVTVHDGSADGRPWVGVSLSVPVLIPGLGGPVHVSAGAGTIREASTP
jgi:pilus assembly protein CpaE